MTYLCVSCEFLPLYALDNPNVVKDHKCNQIFIFYSHKFIPIQQMGRTAVPSIVINACFACNLNPLFQWCLVSLGVVINPDRQIDLFVIKSPFNQHFRSEFEAGFLLVATKSIKTCPDYIKNIKIDHF